MTLAAAQCRGGEKQCRIDTCCCAV